MGMISLFATTTARVDGFACVASTPLNESVPAIQPRGGGCRNLLKAIWHGVCRSEAARLAMEDQSQRVASGLWPNASWTASTLPAALSKKGWRVIGRCTRAATILVMERAVYVLRVIARRAWQSYPSILGSSTCRTAVCQNPSGFGRSTFSRSISMRIRPGISASPSVIFEPQNARANRAGQAARYCRRGDRIRCWFTATH
jgi:hypothetical protein